MAAKSQEDQQFRDEACGSLWAVYLREAEQYDNGLVRSWKEDMDVTLVFSGLYSAVLTAFIVESYKNLQPDPSQTTATLLQHIAERIASPISQESAPPIPSTAFRADPSAVACNILWFMSLTLALSCAFLATFVQQWTRHFLHRTSVLRAPTARARLMSFLYFGLKNFKMHAIVDIIPSLLHLSLFCFFGGMVAFLSSINPAIQWLVLTMLVIIISVYAVFTIMPVINLSSPYQTPLSPLIWRTWHSFWASIGTLDARQSFGKFWRRTKSQDDPILPTTSSTQRDHDASLSNAVTLASHEGRRERETKSLMWTVRSLTNDTELLPFIEALPEVIYGHAGKLHFENFYLLKPILETSDPNLDIIARTFSLFDNSRDYWAQGEHTDRCRLAISNALWSIAYVLNQCPAQFDLRSTGRSAWFTRDQLHLLEHHKDHLPGCWMVSIVALIKSNMLMCQDLHLSLRDPSTVTKQDLTVMENSPRQGEILVEFLNEAAKGLPDYAAMILSTFRALHGHNHAQAMDKSAIHDILLQKFSTVTGKKTCHIERWDLICHGLVNLCNQDEVLPISRLLNKRAKHPYDSSASGPWVPWVQGDDTQMPPYVPYLKAVLASGDYKEDTVAALRNVIEYFDKPFEGVFSTSNPHWWSRLDPIWLDVLAQVESKISVLDTEASSLLLPLPIMIKGMVLKKTFPTSVPQPDNFSLQSFITKYLDPASSPESQPTLDSIKFAFAGLVVQQLECINVNRTSTLSVARHTLKFLDCERLGGVAYEIDPDLAGRLAKQTRRCGEMWRSDPSLKLVTILDYIWRMWEKADQPASSPRSGTPQSTERIAIPSVAAADIMSAANMLVVDPPTEDDIDQCFRPKTMHTLIKRVEIMKELWDDTPEPADLRPEKTTPP